MFRALSLCTCCRHYPRRSSWAYCFAHSPSRISLPRKGCRVGLRIVLFEACSAFTRVTACTLALSPIRDTLIESFSHFVTSMTVPIASGRERLSGGICTHLYEGLACQDVFSRTTFLLFVSFKGSSREHSSALMAWRPLCLAALSGQSPEPGGSRRKARGVDGESACRATMVSGRDPFCVPVDPLPPPLKGSRLYLFN